MSSCSCIYVEDYDEPEFYSATERKARKEHSCCECGRTIEPKEKYEHVSGKWDDIQTYKTCLDCVSVRKSFFCEGYYHLNIWESVGEHLLEIDGELSSECLLSLTPRAREKVCDIIEEVFEELNEMDEEET